MGVVGHETRSIKSFQFIDGDCNIYAHPFPGKGREDLDGICLCVGDEDVAAKSLGHTLRQR